MLTQTEPDSPSRVQTDLEPLLLVDSFECAELSIGEVTAPIRSGELHSVASREGTGRFAIQRDP